MTDEQFKKLIDKIDAYGNGIWRQIEGLPFYQYPLQVITVILLALILWRVW